MKKKILALCLVIVLAATAVIGGTLAYFTDAEVATNTFTVGKVDIILDETDVDTNGKPIEGADRVTGNDYHLVPAHTYTKDPRVTVVENSEPSYIRMFVTLNKLNVLKKLDPDFLPEKYVNGSWNREFWPCVGIVEKDNTVTYEFRYRDIVSTMNGEPVSLLPLFTSFTVPGTATVDDLAKLGDTNKDPNVDNSFRIDIKAQAIQADGFADADAAWTAFEAN